MTAAWLTKLATAPAMKKAGTRHSSTCSRAYHLVRARASVTAPSKRGQPTGSQKKAAYAAAIHTNGFHSLFQSINSRLQLCRRKYLAKSPSNGQKEGAHETSTTSHLPTSSSTASTQPKKLRMQGTRKR